MTSVKQISPPSVAAFEDAIMHKFPRQQKWKEFPGENNMKVPEVWEKFCKMRLGVEFSGSDVIMHKAYWNLLGAT